MSQTFDGLNEALCNFRLLVISLQAEGPETWLGCLKGAAFLARVVTFGFTLGLKLSAFMYIR